MVTVNANIQQQVMDKVNACMALARKVTGRDLVTPEINFELNSYKTNGIAYIGRNTISFNGQVLIDNVNEYISNTVVHEVSHIIDYQLYGIQRTRTGREINHGKTWKTIMSLFGLNGVATYTYPNKTVGPNCVKIKCDKCHISETISLRTYNNYEKKGGLGNFSHTPCRDSTMVLVTNC